MRERLRELPSVDRLAARVRSFAPNSGAFVPTDADAISAARRVLFERRRELRAGARDEPDLTERARERLRPSLRGVLNATGVVIHTNLGRAPLAAPAVAAVASAARGYCNLELSLSSGRRGSRDEHLCSLLCELTGAEDALAVNNGAGAALLAVAALGARGGGVAISRGQLVEIGGSFRVPDVIAQAGVRMIEVGTTNRTRIDDYERAIAEQGASVILRVHQSNFRTLGFVEEVSVATLCQLGVPVIDDVGSGALAEGMEALGEEPDVRDSVRAGAALVCFSGDKLLGGPQAGVLVGRASAVAACRRHPLARALRIGRLPLAALAATLALYRDPQRARREIPVLAMLDADPAVLYARAERLAREVGGEVVDAVARVGGGALPLLELHGPAVAIDPPGRDPLALAARLRAGDPPLVARVSDGRLLVDPRTLSATEVEQACKVLAGAGIVRAGAGRRQQRQLAPGGPPAGHG
jgi:L-seryl-tRNA(Ser) seleniumtransferase